MTNDNNTTPFTIYLAIKNGPDEIRRKNFHDDLIERLRAIDGIKVFHFFSNSNDHIQLNEADDLFVAILDGRLTALEMEIMIDHAAERPSFFFVRENIQPSLIPEYIERIGKRLFLYESIDDIIVYVASYVVIKNNLERL